MGNVLARVNDGKLRKECLKLDLLLDMEACDRHLKWDAEIVCILL